MVVVASLAVGVVAVRGVVVRSAGSSLGRSALAIGCDPMLCDNPVTVGSRRFSCHRCEPCRINRKRLWTNRLLLEAGEHGSNSFLTLTYRDEKLPRTTSGTPTLAPEDLRNWLKRIRKAVSPIRVRYYGVGEYGDETARPHYHVALFGYGCCSNGTTVKFRGRVVPDQCCPVCRLVSSTWGLGDIECGTLEESSAKYLVGYVLKKMTRYDDPRLFGRMPEFARMSLKPGIGQSAMHEVAHVIMQLGLDTSEDDVPSSLRRGSTIAPLGRYLTTQLRKMTGKDDPTKQEAIARSMAQAERLLSVYEAKGLGPNPAKAEIIEAFKQDVLNRVSRHRLYNSRRTL